MGGDVVTTLAIVLIAAALGGLAVGLRIEIRRVKPTTADEDWIAPHAGWVDEHEIRRQFDQIIAAEWKADKP